MDTVSTECRSAIMAKVRSFDTGPELVVRRLFHSLGYRFRLRSTLPGRPDLILRKRNLAVFVHGCFWHGCRRCRKGKRRPASNSQYWEAKLSRTRKRDVRARRSLRRAGWTVLTVWECELRNESKLLNRIREIVPQ